MYIYTYQSGILLVEFVVEGLQIFQTILQLLLRQYQSRYAEVIGPLPLVETASRNQSYPRVLQHLQTVKQVHRLLPRCLYRLLRKPHLRESVHRPLHLTTTYIPH